MMRDANRGFIRDGMEREKETWKERKVCSGYWQKKQLAFLYHSRVMFLLKAIEECGMQKIRSKNRCVTQRATNHPCHPQALLSIRQSRILQTTQTRIQFPDMIPSQKSIVHVSLCYDSINIFQCEAFRSVSYNGVQPYFCALTVLGLHSTIIGP